MEKHECYQETTIALLKQSQKMIEKSLGENKKILKEILENLKGNGKIGIVTEVALLKQSSKRMWRIILLLFSVIIGIAVYGKITAM